MFDCASAPQSPREEACQSGLFETAFLALPAGVAIYSADETLAFTNPAFRSIYGLRGTTLRKGMPASRVLRAIGAPQSHVLGKAIEGSTLTPQMLKSVRGEKVRVTVQSIPGGGWLELHVVELRQPVTNGIDADPDADLQRLPHEASKATFLHIIDTELRSILSGMAIAIHTFKIDGLDAIRVEYGATTADRLVSLIARRVNTTLREGDHLLDISGERFAVMQSGVDEPKKAQSLALRLHKALNAPYRIAGSLHRIRVRSGIALAPKDAKDASSVFDKAEVALSSLPEGAAQYRLYSEVREAFTLDRDGMARDLGAALEAGHLKIFYQPIIDIHKLEVSGFEALMRWHHPVHGLIPASDFIEVAEQTGQIARLGTWAVETACRDAARWPRPYRVSVNFSGHQFGSEDPVTAVRHALDASGLDPSRLEIEITETALLKNEAIVHRQLSELQKLGVKIALDDFGAAYATLANLRDFRFDKIKIDRSFVGEMPDRKACAAIVKAVAGLAGALDIRSVAEGVETLDQLCEVRASGYSEIQGFYFSVAVPAEQIPQVLKDCEEKLAKMRR